MNQILQLQLKLLVFLGIIFILFSPFENWEFGEATATKTPKYCQAPSSEALFANISTINSGNWNDPTIWSTGQIPTLADDVFITSGFTVVFNDDMFANKIEVNGTLRPVDRTVSSIIQTKAINVKANGLLEIGSEADPHTGNITITLIGNDPNDIQCADMGTKFIGAMNGGQVEIHGAPTTSWSQLGVNVAAGSNQITLKESVNWKVGDAILITSSTLDWNEAEQRLITAVSNSGTTFELDTPLVHDHVGVTKTYTRPTDNKTWVADIRAEVGLLSHNILIQGDSDSEINGFGGHIMIMDGSVGNVSNVELFRMGQKAILGRYPFHWHLMGNSSSGQFIKNSSIHRSFNRAITIHGSWNTLVENNFCYDHIGHGVFLEDASEIGNTIKGNVVLLTKRPAPGEELTPSDNQFDLVQNRTPASFWITNPNNNFENNVAAGTQGTGYWFAMPKSPMGASAADPRFSSMQPFKESLGLFKGNKAHSCMSGYDIFDQLDENHAIIRNEGWDNTELHIMEDCTWYANDLGIYTGVGKLFAGIVNANNFQPGPTDNLIFENNIFVDNKLHMMLASYNTVNESVIVADSEEGLYDGVEKVYRDYDGPGRISNTHIVGFNTKQHQFLDKFGAAAKHVNHIFTNITTDHSGLVYMEMPNVSGTAPSGIDFNHPKHPRRFNLSFYSPDGSLTGKPNTTAISNHPFLLVGDEFKPENWKNIYRSDHKFGLGISNQILPFDQYIKTTITRTKPGTPDAAVFYVDGYQEHHQLPLIVNEDFLYTYYLHGGLPASNTVSFVMDDVTPGDVMTVRYKEFGKIPGIAVRIGTTLINQVNSLAELENVTESSYFAETNGDLYVKTIATQLRQVFRILWTPPGAGDPPPINMPFWDTDGDGTNDVVEAAAGTNPFDNNFDCPLLLANIGDSCDDGNPETTNDTVLSNCECGTPFEDDDGDGVPNEEDLCPNLDDNLIRTQCDDGNPATTIDQIAPDCTCGGGLGDNDGDGVNNVDDLCPNLDNALIGTACDDGDANTVNDVYTSNCLCEGEVLVDADNDGVSDADDQCPNTPNGESVNADGCSDSQLDSDNDGVSDADDQCPNTPNGESVNAEGCSDSQLDSDNDGVSDADDQCPNTPNGESVNAEGCSDSQLNNDADNDGVSNADDQCPNTPNGESVNADGCSGSQLDSDNDGVSNADDQCPNTPNGEEVDGNGCPIVRLNETDFIITSENKSCQNDVGSISIVATTVDFFKATLTSGGITTTSIFVQSVTFESLPVGTYDLCIEINGSPETTFCTQTVVPSIESIEVTTELIEGDGLLEISVTGTNVFEYELNGIRFSSNSSNRLIELQEGENRILVYKGPDCPPVYETSVVLSPEIKVFPNPTALGATTVAIPNIGEQVTIRLFDASRRLLYQNEVENVNGSIPVDLTKLSSGLYLIECEWGENREVIRLLKK